MATQTGILTFTGKLGNLIGYRRNSRYYLRSMPATAHQTVATRKASRDFGIASRKGKLIRRAIMPLLDMPGEGSIVNRLNKTLIQAGTGNGQGVQGFRWNKYTGVESFFSCQPISSADGVCHIPAQILSAPGNATHLQISLLAVKINFVERRITGRDTDTFMMDLSKPFDGATLAANVPGKGTLLLVLQVRAYQGTAPIGDRRYRAADIILVQVARSNRKGVDIHRATTAIIPVQAARNNTKGAGIHRITADIAAPTEKKERFKTTRAPGITKHPPIAVSVGKQPGSHRRTTPAGIAWQLE